MVTISVASGKGGTGKTTVALGLALALEECTLIDCDVEAPNCHLFLRRQAPNIRAVTVPVPAWNSELCNRCGECTRVCMFNALALAGQRIMIFPKLCHGCGACTMVCPQGAIIEVARPVGVVETERSGDISLITGRLNVGETVSTPVIRAARKAGAHGRIVIIDSAPGTSCSMVEAVKGCDLCVLVAEPTPFGVHDLHMAVETVRSLGVRAVVVVNRSENGGDSIEAFCRKLNLQIVGRLPFHRKAAEAYARGIHPAEAIPAFREAFRALADQLTALTARC
ncbi:MAG: ATP-binding protein [Armatimonadota bacterium]